MSLQDGSLLAQMRAVITRIERSKNMYRSLCPICRVNRLMTPHEVCDVCFNKIKRRWVHSRQFWENVSGESEAQRRGHRETSVTQEQHKHNVDFRINSEIERWKIRTSPKLTAVSVAIDIIDGTGEAIMDCGAESELAWHLQRLNFVSDCIDRLNDDLFLPASREQLNNCKKMAFDFWRQKDPDGNLREISQYIRHVTDDKHRAKWDAKTLLGMMASDVDDLDFMWTQFIESAVACVEDEFSTATWMMLFDKHFSAEIQQWAISTEESW
ncbi:hypothetical protein [Salmonella enterica]|nr:hypothetical protein [Salmonella enterica]